MGQQGLLQANPDFFFLIIIFIRQTGEFVFRVYMSLTPTSGWYLHVVKLSFYFFVFVENLFIFITTYQSVKQVRTFFSPWNHHSGLRGTIQKAAYSASYKNVSLLASC